MNGQDSAPLTFHWPTRAGPSLWLLAFVLLSLLLHSAAFFIFQGKSGMTRRSPRTSPSVQLLTPLAPDGSRSPDNEAFLQWISTHDPALVASIPTVEPKGLLNIPYKESFQKVRTQPLGVPPEQPTIAFPPPHDPLALIRRSLPRNDAGHASAVPESTRISFSETLAGRIPPGLNLIPASRAGKPVESTALMIGVSGQGAMRFRFLQQSSGSAPLDREASEFTSAIRFSPSASPLEWGVITFHWGDETSVQTETARESPR